MALPPVIVGLYPDVPAFRGVPQLRRSPTPAQIQALAIATAAINGRLWQSVSAAPTWGIYPAGFKQNIAQPNLIDRLLGSFSNPLRPQPEEKANGRAIVPDSIYAFDYRNEYRVSDFPVQQGAFASYNKVATPFDVTLRLVKASTLEGRAQFLTQVDAVLNKLDLYDVVTPERTYRNVNMTRAEITRRSSQGAYFLTEVDVFFRQVVQVAAQYSTTQAATRDAENPSARPSVSQGIVQPAPLPATVADGF